MSFHRYIEPERQNERVIRLGPNAVTYKHDFVPTPPVGTYVAMVFRVVGHDQDCDGSAMMRLEQVTRTGDTTGWEPTHLGAYTDSDVILDSPQDLWDAIG